MELSAEEVVLEHETQCESAVEAFKRDLAKVRSGRASTGLVEGVTADYYGAKTALTHMGQISTPEANLILIQPYDASAVQIIEKAIIEADLGFNPSSDGNTIRIIVPPLTEERRKEIVKHLNKMAEDFRVSIRNHRRDANDKIKSMEKNSEVSKDDAKRMLETIQKQTDSHITQVDQLLKEKEAECMEV